MCVLILVGCRIWAWLSKEEGKPYVYDKDNENSAEVDLRRKEKIGIVSGYETEGRSVQLQCLHSDIH